MQPGPDQARPAPAEMSVKKGRERPTDRARKSGDQRNARDRAASGTAIQPGESGESRVVETHSHPHTEESPRNRQGDDALCHAEEHQPCREHEVGDRQHAATAMLVDGATDRRPKKGGYEKRTRENVE